MILKLVKKDSNNASIIHSSFEMIFPRLTADAKKRELCTLDQALYFHRLIISQRDMSTPLPSIPLIHRLSCTFGVGRLRSVKFALVRTRQKGGGACELSSAELPFIRPYASLVNTLRILAAVRAFPTERCVCYRRA